MVKYKTIMVAVDGSPQAKQAFKHAVDLATLHQSKLVIANVVDPKVFVSGGPYLGDFLNQIIDEKAKMLNDYKDEVQNLQVNTIIQVGQPRTVIAKDLRDEFDVDLIVIGRSGNGWGTRLLLGSTCEYVARHANCDVLIVK